MLLWNYFLFSNACYIMTNGYRFILSVELENRLLSRFDAASQRRELSTMAECAKILSQVIVSYESDQLPIWSLY